MKELLKWNLPERVEVSNTLPLRARNMFEMIFERIEIALSEQLNLSARLSVAQGPASLENSTVFSFRVHESQAKLCVPNSLAKVLCSAIERKVGELETSSTLLAYVLLDLIAVVDSREFKSIQLTGMNASAAAPNLAIQCEISGVSYVCSLEISAGLSRRITWHARRRLGNSPLRALPCKCELIVPCSLVSVMSYQTGTEIQLGSEATIKAKGTSVGVKLGVSDGRLKITGAEAELKRVA